MRRLSKAQKKILDQHRDCTDVDDLPWDIYEILVELNEYETLWQDINRYLWDNAEIDYTGGRW